MINSSETNFVKDYPPGADAVVELTNARFADVINGCFFDHGIRVMIKDGKIAAMPGLKGESTEIKPDLTIDLKGKTVLPGLLNVHCHIQELGVIGKRVDALFMDGRLVINNCGLEV